jgi:ribosomal protein L7Ae-like RNA K-turn-binding protein
MTMENTREAIGKIEETLANEVEAAALKRDLNKMVLALTDTVRQLVVIAKDMADAFEGATPAPAPKKKAPARKKPAAKKPAAKRTQKQPIAPK